MKECEKSLCENCYRADNDCPVWEPGLHVTFCVEQRKIKTRKIKTLKTESCDLDIEKE